MQRRRFLSTLGRAGVAASATFALAGRGHGSGAKPRIRVGQIGTGHAHADGKLAALRRSSEYEVVGVVEPDERLRRAAMARKDYQGVAWLTEEQLFNSPGLKAVAVETEGGAGNGVQLYDAATGALRALDASPSLYRGLAWRRKADDLAVLRTVVDTQARDTAHVVLAFSRASSAFWAILIPPALPRPPIRTWALIAQG